MYNVGKMQHRFRNNPVERAFAEKWEKLNELPSSPVGRNFIDEVLNGD